MSLLGLKRNAIFFLRSGNVLCQGIQERSLITGLCCEALPIPIMCRLLSVLSIGYYAWASRSTSAQASANDVSLHNISDLHEDSDGVWGAQTITNELNMKGIKCSVNRLVRL